MKNDENTSGHSTPGEASRNGSQNGTGGHAPASTMAAPATNGQPKSDEVARLAYQYWQTRMHPAGTPDEEDWARAEQEIQHRSGEALEPAGEVADNSPVKDVPGKATAPEVVAVKESGGKKRIAGGTGSRYLKISLAALVLLNLAVAGYFIWLHFRPTPLGPGFASGNGRIEAVESDVAAQSGGRITEILVDEGDSVKVGQVVAKMDTQVLDAELIQAQAEEAQARNATNTALALVVQHQSEQGAGRATVAQREADRNLADKSAQRSRILSEGHAASIQDYENDAAKLESASAAVVAAQSQVAAWDAAIAASRSQVLEAGSRVAAASAATSRLRAQIEQTRLRAAREGRVQFRIVQPGEVVPAGGKVLSMVDVSDVSMTFFLPEESAGKVAIGSEVRIVLDSAPRDVIQAAVSFVDSVAQFTPKSVETQSERQKLVFRVKATIPSELPRNHAVEIKSGSPGMAYVRIDPGVPWPGNLRSGATR